MDKKKILDNVLDYISGNQPESTVNDPEQKFTSEIIKELQSLQKVNPPYEIYYNLLEKQAQGKSNFIRTESSLWSSRVFQLASGFAVILVVVSVFFWHSFQKNNTDFIVANSYKAIEAGEKIKKTGVEILTKSKGEIAMVSSRQSSNYIMKSGSWSIESDHNQFKKETWFHFPGGGLKPLGTSFEIKIVNGKTAVNLSEGRIQTYSTDKDGMVKMAKISGAPFQESFSGEIPKDMDQVDLLIKQAVTTFDVNNAIKKPVRKKTSPREDHSVYKHFIGAEITVKDKKGNSINGILQDIDNGYLVINRNDRILRVEEKSMTLIGLDTHPVGIMLDK